MLLSALLLAAVVQAAPSPDLPPTPSISRDQFGPGQAKFYGAERQAVASMTVKEACRASGVELAVNVAPTTRLEIKRLGDLPAANHTLTVLRSVDGCPVSSTVRFDVDQPAGR